MLNRLRNTVAMSALLAALLLSPLAPALAVGPIQSQLNVYPAAPTYSASILALTPASSATDVFVLGGSATKNIYPLSLTCTGTSTAAASQMVQAILRSTADTSGTSTAPTIASYDSTSAAATATVAAYTANPTTGTSAGIVGVGLMQTLAPASTGIYGVTFTFNQIGAPQGLVLRGVAQQLAFSLNGVSVASGGSLECNVTWTETSVH